MTIAVAGLGYVGMSIAVLLAQHNEVVALDVNATRVAQVNARHPPIEDAEISKWLAEQSLNLRATSDAAEALTGAEFVIVATPTNYDARSNRFDTSSVETVIRPGSRRPRCGLRRVRWECSETLILRSGPKDRVSKDGPRSR